MRRRVGSLSSEIFSFSPKWTNRLVGQFKSLRTFPLISPKTRSPLRAKRENTVAGTSTTGRRSFAQEKKRLTFHGFERFRTAILVVLYFALTPIERRNLTVRTAGAEATAVRSYHKSPGEHQELDPHARFAPAHTTCIRRFNRRADVVENMPMRNIGIENFDCLEWNHGYIQESQPHTTGGEIVPADP